MARIDKHVVKKGVWNTQGSHWLNHFFRTRLSRRQIGKLEAEGREVVFGRCFNCGWREAERDMYSEDYPVCMRCSAKWGLNVDEEVKSHA